MKRVAVSKERPVVILSTGRAGSTLLQKLLNTNQELIIWGEHDGILHPLMHAWQKVSRSEWIAENEPRGEWLLDKDRPLNADRWTAWDGSFSKQGFNQSMREFVDKLFCSDVPENIRWGFKEIRYRGVGIMDFWSELYPDTQYIFLIRNPIDSCISFTTSRLQNEGATDEKLQNESATDEELLHTMANVAENQIRPVFNFFEEAMIKYAGQSLPIIFENIVDEPIKTLDRVEKFLHLESGFDEGNVSKIMGKDIVSQRKRTSPELKEKLRVMALTMLSDELDWFEKFRLSINIKFR